MSRGRKTSILKDLFHFFTEMPIWIGPIVAMVVYSGFRWGIPFLFPADSPDAMHKTLGSLAGPITTKIAPWAGALVLAIWLLAEGKKWFDRRRLDRQTGIDSIRELNWREFESLLAEAFQRQGYSIEHCGAAGPDGGVDLRLVQSGKVTLVQCKQWRTERVGVNIVRELMGVVSGERAAAGIVVTSGSFTEDAQAFARSVPLRLIAGDELTQLIRVLQCKPPAVATKARMSEPPTCPKCGAPMRVQTAKRGPNPGSQFWGCSRYPACQSTRSISPDA